MDATNASGLAAESWRDARRASGADPLFLGWEWQDTWWRHFGSGLEGAQLRIVTVTGAGGATESLAPLYLQQVRRLPLLNTRSLQFVGSAWRNPRVMLSEYLEPLYPSDDPGPLAALLAAVGGLDWHEFVAALTPRDGAFARATREWCARNGWYLRELEPAEAYHARLDAGFDSYAGGLTSGARRRLYNNRSRLMRHGAVTLRRYQDQQLAAGLEVLNTLHARRWGQQAYDAARLAFLADWHGRLPPTVTPFVSILEVGDTPVSALFDVRLGRRQYNLQMGFDATFDRSLSPGLLHLGYAMEEAARGGVECYDFLGGAGRQTNYKERIATGTVPLITLQVVRQPLLAAVYRLRDRARSARPSAARQRLVE